MTLSPAIPILRIFSVDKAKEFYLDFLGFTLAWEHRFSEDLPLYMQVTRAGLTLHLSEHYGDSTPGAAIFHPGARYRRAAPGAHGQKLPLCPAGAGGCRLGQRAQPHRSVRQPAAVLRTEPLGLIGVMADIPPR
ncbi:glyoxalase/bleomycin resistance protein/dioxygenase [Serratia sp. SCBI]|nr:glyoxalase/bleomycin resistance protein/dioxygenase [Serratia sp. SCBI]